LIDASKSTERDILAEDKENQQVLDGVQGKWIESIVEVSGVALPMLKVNESKAKLK